MRHLPVVLLAERSDSGGLLGRQVLVVDGGHLEVRQSDGDGSRLFAGSVARRSPLRLELHREPLGELLEVDPRSALRWKKNSSPLAVMKPKPRSGCRLARNRALYRDPPLACSPVDAEACGGYASAWRRSDPTLVLAERHERATLPRRNIAWPRRCASAPPMRRPALTRVKQSCWTWSRPWPGTRSTWPSRVPRGSRPTRSPATWRNCRRIVTSSRTA